VRGWLWVACVRVCVCVCVCVPSVYLRGGGGVRACTNRSHASSLVLTNGIVVYAGLRE
jgi:hypothetical protein